MPTIRIVCINRTHSQEDYVPTCRNDIEWVQAVGLCIRHDRPLYIHAHSEDSYIRRYFIEKTLNADGFIIPGNYETETPQLGKIRYLIWNEQSDYYKYIFREKSNNQGAATD